MLATKAGPHWALDPDEASQLDKAIKRAMRHQDMKVTQKQLDYAMLAYVVGTIYGTRIVTSVMLKEKKPPQNSPANVRPIFSGLPGSA